MTETLTPTRARTPSSHVVDHTLPSSHYSIGQPPRSTPIAATSRMDLGVAESAPCSGSIAHLPQDLAIEVLAYLNLRDSNHLGHVNHGWLKASQVERRRILKLTWNMAGDFFGVRLKSSAELWERVKPQFTRVMHSPLARLITHLPTSFARFRLDLPESITAAVTHFPNLLHLAFDLTNQLHLPVQLPPRLTSIHLEHSWSEPMTSEQEQIWLDQLSTAVQLHTVKLKELDRNLNLTVLTQLPLLTDLTIHHWPVTPIPDHTLRLLASMDQLISLSLGWTILPGQWCQLHLPRLRYISTNNIEGLIYSTDFVPLMETVMVKSIHHLRLQLDSGRDLTKLMELVRFRKLEKLDLWRLKTDQPLTAKDHCDIRAALNQLTNLTSLRVRGMSSIGSEYTEVLVSLVHLTQLELSSNSTTDLSFLRTPVAHQRLVDLTLTGSFLTSDLLEGGLLQCLNLRRLSIRSHSEEWWKELRDRLDSRRVLPRLNQLVVLISTDGKFERLEWDRELGSETHPTFRLDRPPVSLEIIGTDALTSITQLFDWTELISFSQVNRHLYEIMKSRHSAYHQLGFPSFHRTEFNLLTYQHWQQQCRPLIMTPEELFVYSRSTVMRHASDIELHIDQCQFHSDPLSSSIVRYGSSTKDPKWVIRHHQPSVDEMRSAVERFHHVRAFKLVFHHRHRLVPWPECPCRKSQTIVTVATETETGTTMVDDSSASLQSVKTTHQLISLCFQLWGSKLLSFAFNVLSISKYECSLPLPLIESHLPLLTSLQHCGVRLHENEVQVMQMKEVEHTFSHVRFASDVGLLNFSGIISEGLNHQPIETQPMRQYTNAAHCLGHDRQTSMNCRPLFEYFYQTQQLTSSSLSTTMPPTNFPRHTPSAPFRRQQLRNLSLDTNDLPFVPKFGLSISGRRKATHTTLQMIVDNFSPITSDSAARTEPSSSLHALNITEYFPSLMNVERDKGVQVDYRSYLHQLRSNLRSFTFNTIRSIDQSLITKNSYFRPDLPFFTQNHASNEAEDYTWPMLESLTLSFKEWERIFKDEYLPSIDLYTWIDLGRTFPQLHSLGLSGCLLPLNQPLVGLLTQIKHLTLHLFNVVVDDDTESDLHQMKIEPRFSTYLRTIVLGARQLESIALKTKPRHIWSRFLPCLSDTLLPLLLSSNHLTHVSCEHHTCELDVTAPFDESLESDLLFAYALWQLLQPSLTVPLLEYSTISDLYSPFLPLRLREILSVIRSPGHHLAMDLTDNSSCSWFNRWMNRLDDQRQTDQTKRMRRTEVSQERKKWIQVRQARQKKFTQIQADLSVRVKELLASSPILNHTIQIRAFTLQLDPV